MTIRIPDGNTFRIRLTARNLITGEYTEAADLHSINNLVINYVRRGVRFAQTFTIDDEGRAIIVNQGTLDCGLYGIELTGYYGGEPFRFYGKDMFEITDDTVDVSDPSDIIDIEITIKLYTSGVSKAYVDYAIGNVNREMAAMEDALRDEISEAGQVDDVKVNGVSVVSQKEANITVPTKVSDLQNDSEFTNKSYVDAGLSGKQDVIDDLSTIRSGAAAGGTAYQKPGTGIPASDLSAEVQDMIEHGGKTKSVSVNGGTPVTPDANGQVDLTIEQANVTIGTVSTGAAGSDAEVHNSGTGTSPVLDFVIPKGDDGGVGPQGPQGDSAVYNPDDPDTPDFVMANTTGQSTTKSMTQKAITDCIMDAKTYENTLIDDSQYQITNIYISHGTQKWRALSGVACVIVPVVEGGIYKLTATLYAAYLSDNTHASGGTPTFAGGTDSEFEWQANEERVLPQGVNFLYLMTKQQNEEITEHELYRIHTIKEQIDKNHSEFVGSIKQTTGDDPEGIMSQEAVTNECKRIENYESEEIDESSYYLPQRYIQHSSQTWKAIASQGCVLIPVKTTGKYTLKGANMYAAYLSDNSHTGTPSFGGGTTSEFTWQDGESKAIPDGVKYLYLLVRNENVDIAHELEYSCSIKEKINEIVSQGKKYEGLKMSILGDSMSTFGVPDQANATGTWTWPGNKCRYPQSDLFTDVRCQYWHLLMERLGLTFGINESIAGSRVTCNRDDDTDNLGPNRCISSLTRIGHLGENGDPDIIIIEAGGNDVGNRVAIGTFNTENPINYTEEQIAALPVATFADAYRAMLIRLQYYYRNSRMVVLLPWFVNDYWTISEADAYIEVIKEECDFFGIEYVDLRQCGITIYNLSNYLGDGIHPNAAGMELICEHLIRHYFN